MSIKLQRAVLILTLRNLLTLRPARSVAQDSAPTVIQLCTPKITANEVVASPKQGHEAGQKAEPPVTYNNAFIAWPDTPMGIIKTANGYEFFGSDGGFHSRQMWQGHWVGNNKWGSVVTIAGTLGNPLGSGAPQDVSISPNPDPAVNPNYSSYQYMGGGPVYQVPAGMTGAGNLLVTYHAELSARPHTVPFEKFYKDSWHLQPGIGGASTDLMPDNSSQERGYIDIHYNSALRRYGMIISDDTTFYYAESSDALKWTTPTVLGTFETIAAYPTAVGLGDDPHTLGKSYYVYFTHLPTDGTGWANGELRRLTVSCR